MGRYRGIFEKVKINVSRKQERKSIIKEAENER